MSGSDDLVTKKKWENLEILQTTALILDSLLTKHNVESLPTTISMVDDKSRKYTTPKPQPIKGGKDFTACKHIFL